MASPCYRLCQVLHGIVPPGLQNSSSAEPLVCVVVKGSTPAVTLLVLYAPWLCRWQAMTFTPRGLSFLICKVGTVVYLRCLIRLPYLTFKIMSVSPLVPVVGALLESTVRFGVLLNPASCVCSGLAHVRKALSGPWAAGGARHPRRCVRLGGSLL